MRENPTGLSPDLDRLVWTAVTLLLEGHDGASLVWFHSLSRALLLYANTPVTVGGRSREAPCRGIDPRQSLPSPETVFRRMGIDEESLIRELARARARDDVAPRLPRVWAEALVPAPVWPVVAATAADGPRVASARLQQLLDLEGERVLAPTRSRPEGGRVSRGHLAVFVSATHRLFAVLVALRGRGVGVPYVEHWSACPPRPKLKAHEANTDQTGPPRTTLRIVHRHLDNNVKRLLGLQPGQDELAAIGRVSQRHLRHSGAIKALRNRTLFDLLAVVGMRGGALVRLRRCDFEPQHRCLDGVLRPAVGLRPRKGLARDEVRWKVLPEALALEICAYTAALERVAPETLEPAGALIAAKPSSPNRGMDRHALHGLFAGADRSDANPRIALVPFSLPALNGEIGDNPATYLGYSPHRLRHSALKMTREGARRYVADMDLEMDPECLSEVLLDHDVRSDRYGYGDLSNAQGREKWTAVAIEVNWQMLTGDMGARKALDADGFRAAVRERNAVAAEIGQLRHQIDRSFAAMETTARSTPRSDAIMKQILELLRAQTEVTLDHRHERRLEARLRELDVELERIRNDPARVVLVPDDAPPGAERVDLDRIEREETVACVAIVPALGAMPAVRDWITVNELADLAGVSRPSARRWAGGQLLPFPARDPRNPWVTEVPPVDRGVHSRRRRIAVTHMSSEFLAPAARRRLLEEQLATWPVGWSLEECQRPLVIPDTCQA